MLTADFLDSVSDPILALYERFSQSVIADIARRLSNMDYSSAAWQVQRITESGQVYERVLEELSKVTGQSEQVLREIFRRSGVKAMRFDDAIYKAAGLNPLPLNMSPAMASVLAAGLQKTGGIIRNLTLTTAMDAQNLFTNAADLAYMQVSSGAMDYQSALRSGVKQLARDGLSVISYGGRRDHLDVALRRAVLTGVGQTTGQLAWTRADEMGCDLVQTTAHIGARPEHALWQGQIFSRSGRGKYPDFVTSTGYGSATGLLGINCRHHYYPFFEGISENAYSEAQLKSYASATVTFNGREMSVYDATQIQRGIERKIRYWKRKQSAMEAADLNTLPEREAIKHYQAQMREFIRQTGLDRDRFREQIFEG